MMSAGGERGYFISLEGIEGVGKTSNVAFVADLLRAATIETVVTREPGGTPLAEQLRALMLAHRDEVVDPLTEVLLMFAARRQHLTEVIEPALAAGRWVVCDRFTDATLAYQGYGRGFDIDRIRALATWCHADGWPDLTLVLDADIDTALSRRRGRGDTADRFEVEDVDFFSDVRAGYLRAAAEEPERIAVIDASRELRHVQTAIREQVTGFVERVLV
ncbi:MAG: dTMP kinase [Pseudomonadota bacterium]